MGGGGISYERDFKVRLAREKGHREGEEKIVRRQR